MGIDSYLAAIAMLIAVVAALVYGVVWFLSTGVMAVLSTIGVGWWFALLFGGAIAVGAIGHERDRRRGGLVAPKGDEQP